MIVVMRQDATKEQLDHVFATVQDIRSTRSTVSNGPSWSASATNAASRVCEVHPHPEEAFSDGAQSLRPDQFDRLMSDLARIAVAVG